MTGEQLYRAHRGSASDLGIAELPPWEELTYLEHCHWDEQAYEQTLRDRDFDRMKEYA